MKIVLTQEQVKRIIQENIEELNYQSLQDDENLQDLRDSIDKNKLVSVAFVKKDGNVKHMLIRKSLSSYVGSEREKTDAQRNVEMNHDLKKVVDVNAYKREIKRLRAEAPEANDAEVKQMAAKMAWRSINLRNVLGFMVGGRFIDLRDENEIMDRYGEAVHGQLTKSMIGAMQAQAPVNDNPEPEAEVNETIYDNVKLRKLTMRSTWDFNPKHQGWTIDKVMEYAPKSLLWAYLCMEKITFVDEILEMLKEKYDGLELIEKPGVDKEQYNELDNQSNPWSKFTYPELKQINAAKRANGQRVPRSLLATMDRKKSFYLKDKHDADFEYTNVDSKATMQAKNQGKIP